jgi:hypothetical protein
MAPRAPRIALQLSVLLLVCLAGYQIFEIIKPRHLYTANSLIVASTHLSLFREQQQQTSDCVYVYTISVPTTSGDITNGHWRLRQGKLSVGPCRPWNSVNEQPEDLAVALKWCASDSDRCTVVSIAYRATSGYTWAVDPYDVREDVLPVQLWSLSAANERLVKEEGRMERAERTDAPLGTPLVTCDDLRAKAFLQQHPADVSSQVSSKEMEKKRERGGEGGREETNSLFPSPLLISFSSHFRTESLRNMDGC